MARGICGWRGRRKSSEAANSPAMACMSRLMAADSLPDGDVRFVFLAMDAEVEVESSLDLTARSWIRLGGGTEEFKSCGKRLLTTKRA